MKVSSLDLFRSCEGFEWDRANRDKIRSKHRLEPQDIEAVFFDPQLTVFDDIKHSNQESRYVALGKTREGKLLFVAYTIRDHNIRVISARPAHKEKEVDFYEKAA